MNRAPAEWDDLAPADRAPQLGRAGAPALGVEVAVDGQGEVLARCNHVMDGYWDQPEATADAIVDGWFHTGDGGRSTTSGYLTISDRKKDVIISGGENVSSIEVEDCLFSHPAVAEVAVIGVPDEKWGETVKALVVLAPGAEATEAELIAHWRKSKLARYKCPTSVEFRDELARTATGKLQKPPPSSSCPALSSLLGGQGAPGQRRASCGRFFVGCTSFDVGKGRAGAKTVPPCASARWWLGCSSSPTADQYSTTELGIHIDGTDDGTVTD